MCCIFGFIKWSISCIQRSLTFLIGFWVVVMVVYALALALGAGVAFGYDYSLAEYTVLARPDMKIRLKPREYVPEDLYRRSGRESGIFAEGDEFKALAHTAGPMIVQLAEIIPTWLYKATNKYLDSYPEPTRTTQTPRQTSRTRTAKRKVHKKTTASELTTGKEKSSSTSKILDSSTASLTSVTTSPREVTQTPEQNVTKTVSTVVSTEQANPPFPSVIRVFVPRSTVLKWRPTKPEKFFYKTPVKYQRRKTKEDSYHPEMEIRIPSFGRYKGLPMRHWHVPTTEAAALDTSPEETYEKNILYF